jgi:hypothetical protein
MERPFEKYRLPVAVLAAAIREAARLLQADVPSSPAAQTPKQEELQTLILFLEEAAARLRRE